MDRFLRILIFLVSLQFATQQEMGNCSCAVFSTNWKKLEPIFERSLPYNVTCDQEGLEKCEQLCTALAETAKEKAPELICEQLNIHVDNLQIELHAKVCLNPVWAFTGLKNTDPICCHGRMATMCTKEVTAKEE